MMSEGPCAQNRSPSRASAGDQASHGDTVCSIPQPTVEVPARCAPSPVWAPEEAWPIDPRSPSLDTRLGARLFDSMAGPVLGGMA
jgi:hypothetical protein